MGWDGIGYEPEWITDDEEGDVLDISPVQDLVALRFYHISIG